MSNLWFFYDQFYQRVPLSNGQPYSLTIGPDADQTVTIRGFPFSEGAIMIEIEDGGFAVLQNGSKIGDVNENTPFQLKEQNKSVTIFLTLSDEKEKTYYLGYHPEIRFSSFDKDAEIFKTGSAFVQQTKDSF